MYSITFGPMVVGHALNAGSTFFSVPPLSRLNIRNASSPNDDAGMDCTTTLPLYFGSARSPHEVGGVQPLSAKILVL